jgi:hypothetical protein
MADTGFANPGISNHWAWRLAPEWRFAVQTGASGAEASWGENRVLAEIFNCCLLAHASGNRDMTNINDLGNRETRVSRCQQLHIGYLVSSSLLPVHLLGLLHLSASTRLHHS